MKRSFGAYALAPPALAQTPWFNSSSLSRELRVFVESLQRAPGMPRRGTTHKRGQPDRRSLIETNPGR